MLEEQGSRVGFPPSPSQQFSEAHFLFWGGLYFNFFYSIEYDFKNENQLVSSSTSHALGITCMLSINKMF